MILELTSGYNITSNKLLDFKWTKCIFYNRPNNLKQKYKKYINVEDWCKPGGVGLHQLKITNETF